MKPRGIVRPMVAALIVAIGVAIISGTVFMWSVGIVESWTRPVDTVYENISVTRDGIPVIQSYSISDYEHFTYRTLEGQPIEVGNDNSLNAASLPEAIRPPRFFSQPLGWGQTLSASDFARPRGGWYLVRDNQPEGRAYFVGYDEFSKMPIGCLGSDGLRRGLPPVDEWFDVGLSNGYWMGAASTQYLNYNGPANQYNPGTERDNLPAWLVFVIDGERLQEVNLQDRRCAKYSHVAGPRVGERTNRSDFADGGRSRGAKHSENGLSRGLADARPHCRARSLGGREARIPPPRDVAERNV